MLTAAEREDHVATAIDAVASRPVLVVGSPPPGGRDLDLLARPDEYQAISEWLLRKGFVQLKNTWARLDRAPLYAVDLSSTARWTTARQDASGLFADAEDLPGFDRLVAPSPATVLLLAARGTVTRRGRITEKVARRVDLALQRDPAAWALAEASARELGLLGALHLLRRAYEQRAPLSPGARVAGLAQVLSHEGPLSVKAHLLLDARPRRLRPPVVSFSGLDGSGKSTQVLRLQDGLRELGMPAEVQWAGFKSARLLRRALPLLDRPRGARGGSQEPPDRMVPTALLHSTVGRQAWAFAVVAVNLIHLWRLVLRRRPKAKVLIFDRFTPDSTVKLQLHFCRSRRIDVRWQRAVFTRLAPKPDVGFLVDVSSKVAYFRRQEQTPEELATMAELYQEQLPRYDLVRLDGTEPPDVLAERIRVAAWQSLG